MKCQICKGRGVVYIPRIRFYPKCTRDLGYWEICACVVNKKKLKLKK